MARDIETILSAMRANPEGVKFNEACTVAEHFFGEFGKPRINGSHHVYKMPWPGDPRINIQKDGPKAKRYQVIQILEAVDKLKALKVAQPLDAATTAAPVKLPGKKEK
jgi:hypothetical protein